jgi:hypothetical protein
MGRNESVEIRGAVGITPLAGGAVQTDALSQTIGMTRRQFPRRALLSRARF